MTEFYFRNISFVELRYIKRTTVKGSNFLGGCFVKDNPRLCRGVQKSFSVAYENKTPFDTIKMRLPTASNKSKGGHSK